MYILPYSLGFCLVLHFTAFRIPVTLRPIQHDLLDSTPWHVCYPTLPTSALVLPHQLLMLAKERS